jgi:cobalt/nickel transport system permease protein
MPPLFLDSYCRLDSPIRRLPAVAKLAAALGSVVATVLMPLAHWFFFAGFALFLAGTTLVSRIPAKYLVRRLLLLEPLVLGIAVLAWFQPGGGLVFARIVVKSTLCLWTMILLSNTTPFAEILRVLQRCRVPGLLITTLALMYRYLFVLLDEAERMKRARASRSFAPQPTRRWQSLASVVALLFIRTSERAERIYAAMCARGWK